MHCWGNVPLNSVIPFFIPTFDGTTGASEAWSGIAVTDIEVYKGVSMTQRASDNGYTLLDTDGIDVDGIVGIGGFSIDTSDNSDAGFFVAGSFYTVVVASVTIDGQTVNFVAGTFHLIAQSLAAEINDVQSDISTLAGLVLAIDDFVDTEITDIQARLPAALVGGRMDSSVGAIAAGVDLSATMKASVNTEVDTAFTTQIADSVPADGTLYTREQALYIITQMLTEFGIASTTMTVYKVDGTTALMSFTLNDGTNPTALTRAT